MTPTWTLRVATAGDRTARVTTRQQQFTVTRPVSFDVELAGVTALEYALGAIGAELVTGLQELARRRRLVLDNLEAVVVGELNHPLAYLEVVGEARDPSIGRVRVKVYLTSPEPETAIDELVHDALEVLPLARTFSALVQFDLDVVRIP